MLSAPFGSWICLFNHVTTAGSLFEAGLSVISACRAYRRLTVAVPIATIRAYGILVGLLAVPVLSVAEAQTFTVLHKFTGSDGDYPQGDLVFSGSTLYGVAENAGNNHAGNVFAVNTDGSNFSVLHSFTNSDGYPNVGLAINGSTLYGTTINSTVFKINTDGSGYTALRSLSEATEGMDCWSTPTLIGSTLIGSATWGGTGGCGTIFSMSTGGSSFKVLHAFSGSDGEDPVGAFTLIGSPSTAPLSMAARMAATAPSSR